jgi:hypothetical protein
MSVFDGQQRLISIAESIKVGIELNHADAIFLSDALYKIVEGDDPKQTLNIKPKRGERTSKAYQQKLKDGELRKIVALSWIATVTLPENEGGLGLTVEEATGRAETIFGYTYETLNTYLSKYDKLRKVIFKLPD